MKKRRMYSLGVSEARDSQVFNNCRSQDSIVNKTASQTQVEVNSKGVREKAIITRLPHTIPLPTLALFSRQSISYEYLYFEVLKVLTVDRKACPFLLPHHVKIPHTEETFSIIFFLHFLPGHLLSRKKRGC